MKKLIVFANGEKDGGGSGANNLANFSKLDCCSFEIVAFVSTHENGGVRKYAEAHGIKFIYFTGGHSAENYLKVFEESGAELISLSGWLGLVKDLPAETMINIHPGPIPEAGGKGMHGHFVHERVIEWVKAGKKFSQCNFGSTCINMHFVDKEFDTGKIFFTQEIPFLSEGMIDAVTLYSKYVRPAEHYFQPFLTDLFVRAEIKLLSGEVWFSEKAGIAISYLQNSYKGEAKPTDEVIEWYKNL